MVVRIHRGQSVKSHDLNSQGLMALGLTSQGRMPDFSICSYVVPIDLTSRHIYVSGLR